MSGGNSGTTGGAPVSDPRAIDRRADWTAFWWLVAISLLGQSLAVWSHATEVARAGQGAPVAKVALWEFSSVAVILALFPLVVMAVSRAMPGQHEWRRLVAVHLPTLLLFSALHVLGFVILRKIGHALFWDESYIFTDSPGREFAYEFRKDVLSYALIATVVVLSRQFAQLKADLETARRDAAATRQLAVKSGGRTVYLSVSEILSAQSGGNYVDVTTARRSLTLRSTLADFADQVRSAGGEMIRVHRSWLVSRSAVTEFRSTASGDGVVVLEGGREVPVSRRYRQALEAALSP